MPIVGTLDAAATPLAVLAKRISAACADPMDTLADTVRAALHAASTERALLSAQQMTARIDRYARHLLYADPAGRFTIVSIVWRPGQYTPIHGHYTWCGYAVIAGTLREESFDWVPESRGAAHAGSSDRFAGYTCFANAGVDSVHRMTNRSDCDAVSVHIYGVDGPRVGTHVNRLLCAID